MKQNMLPVHMDISIFPTKNTVFDVVPNSKGSNIIRINDMASMTSQAYNLLRCHSAMPQCGLIPSTMRNCVIYLAILYVKSKFPPWSPRV